LRRALVTGAAAGLLAGVAVELACDGFDGVCITFRTTPPDGVLARIAAAGARASAARLDFSADETSVIAALDAAIAAHGPFDTLIHGVGPIVVKRFARLNAADYREMFDGNVRSAVLAAAAVLPAMRDARFGRIVFFGTNGSSETRPHRGFTLYGAAKSAVVAFARSLAIEEAEFGITVNVIEPGDIRDKAASRGEARARTGPAPRGRPGSYEDVADVVRFLVSADRDFVTGAVIGVTGGLTVADERNADKI
jgi:3-oxoacyl-[acyl-carrier protein] reductase